MLYNEYGSTGINVSKIGFGGMRFENINDFDASAEIVKLAYDNGINYFDTAPLYAKSEDIFGVAFNEMNKSRTKKPFYVATKTFASDPANVRKDLENSLQRMNLDHIDFHHVWCILSLDAYNSRKQKGVLDEFEKLQREGLIKHICVSTHMIGEDVGKLLADYPFAGVLLGYCVSNFAYREKALEAAANLKRGVVVMNPLSGGAIPKNPDRFAFVKTRPDESVVDAAIRFLLNDPRITVALVGMGTKSHVTDAINAVAGFKPISQQKITEIRSNLKEAFNSLCTACRYCDDCPQSIPIPQLMLSYNHFLLTGESLEMVNQIRYAWGVDFTNNPIDNCTKCRLCESACTQKLDIINRLDIIKKHIDTVLADEAAKKLNNPQS